MACTARCGPTRSPAAPLAEIWADRAYLRDVQYKSDANLAARQSIYAYQEPKIDIAARALDIAGVPAGGVVADVGCGNGAYLAELARRGFGGRVIGADLSLGMLSAAIDRGVGAARLVNADATALPLRDGAADLTLAMHMLYHVPSPPDAVRELRRITRQGGTAVVALNADDHMGVLREALQACGVSKPGDRVRLDHGEALLRLAFSSVTRHDFVAPVLPPPEAVAAYVRSLHLSAPEPVVTRVLSLLFPNDQSRLTITSHSGILVCA